MDIINNKEELYDNIKQIDTYLNKKVEPTYGFALELIRYGRCFIALSTENGIKFYPSRFIGYKNNTMDIHISNREDRQVDGRETNPIITALIGRKNTFDTSLEQEYIKYCEKLDLDLCNYKRSYWKLTLDFFNKTK